MTAQCLHDGCEQQRSIQERQLFSSEADPSEAPWSWLLHMCVTGTKAPIVTRTNANDNDGTNRNDTKHAQGTHTNTRKHAAHTHKHAHTHARTRMGKRSQATNNGDDGGETTTKQRGGP